MKRSLMNLSAGLIAVGLALTGCEKAVNPDRAAPATEKKIQIVASADQTVEFKSKVDILFVVDDSESMREEQTAIANNIDRFANGLGRMLDWRVGVTTVWEAWARDPRKPAWNPTLKNFPGRNRPFEPQKRGGMSMAPGQLLPVMNPEAPDQVLPYAGNGVGNIGRRWIDRNTTYGSNTSEDAYVKLLKSHIKVGFRPFEEGGPRWEQVLYPVLAALNFNTIDDAEQKAQVRYYNSGFFRRDSLIVIIMVTDIAKDSSPEEAADVIGQLEAMRPNRPSEYMTFLATALSPAGSGCNIDDEGNIVRVANAATKLRTLVQQTNRDSGSNMFDLCGRDYGSHLASMGEDIRRRRGPIVFRLRDTPDLANGFPKLMYGDTNHPELAREIPQSLGWHYDAANESLVVGTDIRLPKDGGPNLWVKTQAVDVTRRNIVYK